MNNTVEERSISCVSPTAVSNIQVSPTYNFQIFNLSKKKKQNQNQRSPDFQHESV